jgi:hypothetical protein
MNATARTLLVIMFASPALALVASSTIATTGRAAPTLLQDHAFAPLPVARA